jgi:deoxyadenosine/deoxycytidine kinase
MLLIGYIEKHKEVCTEEDCPLKVYKKRASANGRQNSDIEESTIQLIKQLERMYISGIKKYPTCTKLRLSFAFFHLERTKNKKKAYE